MQQLDYKKLEGKKILVTGSNGLLGQTLVSELLTKSKSKVFGISHADGRTEFSVNPNFSYTTLDLTDFEKVSAYLKDLSPDYIVNTAAMTNVDQCESDRDGCWKLNVNAVKTLHSYASNNNCFILHLSTDFVFDGENGPYKETDETSPLSYYGKSKVASEEIFTHSSFKSWAVARTIIVYGKVPNMSRSNIVLWAKGALEKGDPLTIVDDQYRMPTHVLDLAQGCISILIKEATGIYHLSGKDFMSIIELVNRVANFFNFDTSIITPISSEMLNQVAKRPPRTGFILNKAFTELDYKPMSFEEGLSKIDFD